MLLRGERNHGEKGRKAREIRGSKEYHWEWRAIRGSTQEVTTTFHHSKLALAVPWLTYDNPHCLLCLQKRAMQKAQQSWHSMLQGLAKSPAPSTSIEAPPSTDVLELHQLLQKPKTALAVQLQTGKYCFNVFLYQACAPSVISLLCSCRFGHQTAKQIIIHWCKSMAASC